MCCSLHASEMSNTKLYAGEALRNGTYVHVMAYSNTAVTRGPNAMVLPIPASGALGPENMIDTRKFKSFLTSIAEATKVPTRSFGGSPATDGDLELAEVFDKGSYTVVLGTRMDAAMTAIEGVPANKRPTMNPEVLSALAGHYPAWAFAICCWDGAIEAEPLLWWYPPMQPDQLFAPALDAHDGRPPQDGPVDVDHHVIFGSTITPLGPQVVYYDEPIPAHVRALLPERAIGDVFHHRMPNGDFWFSTSGFKRAKPEGTALRFFPGTKGAEITVPLRGNWG